MSVLGLGLDLVEIARVDRLLAGPLGARFRRRCFTESERRYCEAPSSNGRRAERYAARFAAKEALAKALGCVGGLSFQDAEILSTPQGPLLRLTGQASIEIERRGARALVTLTHDGGMAAAMVVIDEKERA